MNAKYNYLGNTGTRSTIKTFKATAESDTFNLRAITMDVDMELLIMESAGKSGLIGITDSTISISEIKKKRDLPSEVLAEVKDEIEKGGSKISLIKLCEAETLEDTLFKMHEELGFLVEGPRTFKKIKTKLSFKEDEVTITVSNKTKSTFRNKQRLEGKFLMTCFDDGRGLIRHPVLVETNARGVDEMMLLLGAFDEELFEKVSYEVDDEFMESPVIFGVDIEEKLETPLMKVLTSNMLNDYLDDNDLPTMFYGKHNERLKGVLEVGSDEISLQKLNVSHLLALKVKKSTAKKFESSSISSFARAIEEIDPDITISSSIKRMIFKSEFIDESYDYFDSFDSDSDNNRGGRDAYKNIKFRGDRY